MALTTAQQAKVTDIQNAIANAEVALLALIQSAESVRSEAAALNTTTGAKASNAALRLKGVARELIGRLQQAHADASDGLIGYDASYGTVVAMGGGGGRGN